MKPKRIRRIFSVSIVTALVLALGALTQTAVAGCHVAAFVETDVSVGEDAGTATVTVELQGRADSCEGTVNFETMDGTAAEGSDYEQIDGTLEFESGDDRVEDIKINIIDDTDEESAESFGVLLTPAAGSGLTASTIPATVTINDNDGANQGGPDQPTDGTGGPDTTADTTAGDDSGGSSANTIIIVILGVGVVVVFLVMRSRKPKEPS